MSQSDVPLGVSINYKVYLNVDDVVDCDNWVQVCQDLGMTLVTLNTYKYSVVQSMSCDIMETSFYNLYTVIASDSLSFEPVINKLRQYNRCVYGMLTDRVEPGYSYLFNDYYYISYNEKKNKTRLTKDLNGIKKTPRKKLQFDNVFVKVEEKSSPDLKIVGTSVQKSIYNSINEVTPTETKKNASPISCSIDDINPFHLNNLNFKESAEEQTSFNFKRAFHTPINEVTPTEAKKNASPNISFKPASPNISFKNASPNISFKNDINIDDISILKLDTPIHTSPKNSRKVKKYKTKFDVYLDVIRYLKRKKVSKYDIFEIRKNTSKYIRKKRVMRHLHDIRTIFDKKTSPLNTLVNTISENILYDGF
jgi:hypothetical protein